MSALTGTLAPSWSTACPDWRERLLEGRSLVPELPLFAAQRDHGLRVFKRLRIPDVPGRPRMADACGPWYFDIVAALCGSYDIETERRLIQEYFLLVPKGNAKSSNGGALMLTATIVNRRPEAEFDFIAPTIKVASIAFQQAANTVRADPELEKVFQIREHIRTIEHRTFGSKLQIKAADTDVVTGSKATGTAIDETHVFAEKSNAADIFIELRGALGKRPDGFLIQTTTQSKREPAGQFKAEVARARAVRDGTKTLPLLPILYEFPETLFEGEAKGVERIAAILRERKYWPIVNPNLGRSLDPEWLGREVEDALEAGGEKLTLFASQHFNIEIGQRLRGDGWPGAIYWENAGVAVLRSLDELLARCEVVVVGIDGGGLDDLTGLCVLGRDRRTKIWLCWCHAWAHRKVLELRKEIAPRLLDFEKDGDLTFWGSVDVQANVAKRLLEDGEETEFVARPDGGVLNQDLVEITAICVKVRDTGLMPEDGNILVDAAAIGGLVDALDDKDFTRREQVDGDGGDIWPISQTAMNMLSPNKTIVRKLEDGTFAHAAQPLMAWCVSNAKEVQKGNAVAITKQDAGKAKIDPVIAMFNAAKRLEQNPEASGGKSFWEAAA